MASGDHTRQHSPKSRNLEDEKGLTEEMKKKSANSLAFMQHTFSQRIQIGKKDN